MSDTRGQLNLTRTCFRPFAGRGHVEQLGHGAFSGRKVEITTPARHMARNTTVASEAPAAGDLKGNTRYGNAFPHRYRQTGRDPDLQWPRIVFRHPIGGIVIRAVGSAFSGRSRSAHGDPWTLEARAFSRAIVKWMYNNPFFRSTFPNARLIFEEWGYAVEVLTDFF